MSSRRGSHDARATVRGRVCQRLGEVDVGIFLQSSLSRLEFLRFCKFSMVKRLLELVFLHQISACPLKLLNEMPYGASRASIRRGIILPRRRFLFLFFPIRGAVLHGWCAAIWAPGRTTGRGARRAARAAIRFFSGLFPAGPPRRRPRLRRIRLGGQPAAAARRVPGAAGCAARENRRLRRLLFLVDRFFFAIFVALHKQNTR